jgi:hypothetical protein
MPLAVNLHRVKPCSASLARKPLGDCFWTKIKTAEAPRPGGLRVGGTAGPSPLTPSPEGAAFREMVRLVDRVERPRAEVPIELR